MRLPASAPWWLRRHLQKPGTERPYTNGEIAKLRCMRCEDPAEQQWQVCADGNIWRPMCTPCDVAVNAMVLEFMRHPDASALIAAYREEMLGS